MKTARNRQHLHGLIPPALSLICALVTAFSSTIVEASAKGICTDAMASKEDEAFKRLGRDGLERMHLMYDRAQERTAYMLLNRALMNPDPRLTKIELDGAYADLSELTAGVTSSKLTDRQIFDTRNSWLPFYEIYKSESDRQLPYILGAIQSGAQPGGAVRFPEGVARPDNWRRMILSFDGWGVLMDRASKDPAFGEDRARLLDPMGMPNRMVTPARQIFELAYRELYFTFAPHPHYSSWMPHFDSQGLHDLSKKIFETRETVSKLVFVSGRENPSHFHPDARSPHRLATTGSKPGSPIYINTDLIEVYDETGKPKFGLPEAMGILAHELGHHHGFKDTPDRPLDRFGGLLANYIRSNTEEIELPTASGKSVRVQAIRSRPMDSEGQFYAPKFAYGIRTRLLVSDPKGTYDLTPALREAVILKVREQFSDIEYYWTRPLTQFAVSNLRVERGLDEDATIGHNGLRTHFLKGDVDVFYFHKKKWAQPAKSTLTLRVQTDNDGVFVRFDPEIAGHLTPLIPSRIAKSGEIAKVLAAQANATSLNAGQTWQVRAQIEVPAGLEVAKVEAVIGSPQFKRDHLVTGSPLIVPATIVRKGERLDAAFDFATPTGSPSRDYHIDEIRVCYADLTCDLLKPTFLQTVKVTGREATKPARLTSASISGGKISGLPPGLGGFNVYPWNSRPVLKFEISGLQGEIKELKLLTGDVVDVSGFSRWRHISVDLFDKGDGFIRSVRIEKPAPDKTIVLVELDISDATVGVLTTQVRLQQLYVRDDRLAELSVSLGENFVIFREK